MYVKTYAYVIDYQLINAVLEIFYNKCKKPALRKSFFKATQLCQLCSKERVIGRGVQDTVSQQDISKFLTSTLSSSKRLQVSLQRPERPSPGGESSMRNTSPGGVCQGEASRGGNPYQNHSHHTNKILKIHDREFGHLVIPVNTITVTISYHYQYLVFHSICVSHTNKSSQ